MVHRSGAAIVAHNDATITSDRNVNATPTNSRRELQAKKINREAYTEEAKETEVENGNRRRSKDSEQIVAALDLQKTPPKSLSGATTRSSVDKKLSPSPSSSTLLSSRTSSSSTTPSSKSTSPSLQLSNKSRIANTESISRTSSSSCLTPRKNRISSQQKRQRQLLPKKSLSSTTPSLLRKSRQNLQRNTDRIINPENLTAIGLRTGLRSNSLELNSNRSDEDATNQSAASNTATLPKKRGRKIKKKRKPNDFPIRKCISADNFHGANRIDDGDENHLPLKLTCSLPLERLSGILNSILAFNTEMEGNAARHTAVSLVDSTDAILKSNGATVEEDSRSGRTAGVVSGLNDDEDDISDHSSQQPIKSLCLYCDKKFSSQKLRIKHTERVHTIVEGRRLSSRNSMSCPSMISYPGCSYCCNTSSKLTTAILSDDLKSLFHHLMDFHSDKYFACRHCEIRFTSQELRDQHAEFKHTTKTPASQSSITAIASTSQAFFSGGGGTTIIKSMGKKSKTSTPLEIASNSKLSQPLQIEIDGTTERISSAPAKTDKREEEQRDNESPQPESTPTKTRRQIKQAMMNKPLTTRSCQNLLRNDEAILSRLGVAQNRLPRGRKGVRNRRIANIELPKMELTPSIAKTRSKVGRVVTSIVADTVEISGRPANANRIESVNNIFDHDFYETVSINVKTNLNCHLDGKLKCEPTSHSPLSSVATVPAIRSAAVCSPFATDSEIHEATALTMSTAFPTLLTAEQYGSDLISASKIKKPITKNSWKWKWDCVKKYKYVNEGGKIVKKIKQPIAGLRDLSKLDMWTQLTMRTKHEMVRREAHVQSGASQVIGGGEITRDEKRKQIAQLNTILDSRRLPQIVLEQSEQTVIKVEVMEDSLVPGASSASISSFSPSVELENTQPDDASHDRDIVPRTLNLTRHNPQSQASKDDCILSGEWARPRCYICFGCGARFDKLKSIEEHKMFRHPHVYSTHYEIVGRELIEGNLYKHFYIPTKALHRQHEYKQHVLMVRRLKTEDNDNAVGEESMDSLTTISASTTTVTTATSGCSDSKVASDGNSSASRSGGASSSLYSSSLTNADIEEDTSVAHHVARKCTKCKRECSGLQELYRHMLDCSGDYAWLLAKKRKYRYYVGSRRRRHNIGFQHRKSIKCSTASTSSSSTKRQTKSKARKQNTPRPPRPSDAESIRRMLENLPAKRACKQIIPNITKPLVRKFTPSLGIKKTILVNTGPCKKGKTSIVHVASTTVAAISKNIRRKHKRLFTRLKRSPRTVKSSAVSTTDDSGEEKSKAEEYETITIDDGPCDQSHDKKSTKSNSKEKSNLLSEVEDSQEKVPIVAVSEIKRKIHKKNVVQKLGTRTRRLVKTITQKFQPNRHSRILRNKGVEIEKVISIPLQRVEEPILQKGHSSKTKQMKNKNNLLHSLSFRKSKRNTPDNEEINNDTPVEIPEKRKSPEKSDNSEKVEKSEKSESVENTDQKTTDISVPAKPKLVKKKSLKSILSRLKRKASETENGSQQNTSNNVQSGQEKVTDNKNESNETGRSREIKSTTKAKLKTPSPLIVLESENCKNSDNGKSKALEKSAEKPILEPTVHQNSNCEPNLQKQETHTTSVRQSPVPPPSTLVNQISPTMRRRSKKLNDCIAMLTGKLQEKLGKPFFESNENLETVLASSKESLAMSIDEPIVKPSRSSATPVSEQIERTPKRKSICRRLIKKDPCNSDTNEDLTVLPRTEAKAKNTESQEVECDLFTLDSLKACETSSARNPPCKNQTVTKFLTQKETAVSIPPCGTLIEAKPPTLVQENVSAIISDESRIEMEDLPFATPLDLRKNVRTIQTDEKSVVILNQIIQPLDMNIKFEPKKRAVKKVGKSQNGTQSPIEAANQTEIIQQSPPSYETMNFKEAEDGMNPSIPMENSKNKMQPEEILQMPAEEIIGRDTKNEATDNSKVMSQKGTKVSRKKDSKVINETTPDVRQDNVTTSKDNSNLSVINSSKADIKSDAAICSQNIGNSTRNKELKRDSLDNCDIKLVEDHKEPKTNRRNNSKANLPKASKTVAKKDANLLVESNVLSNEVIAENFGKKDTKEICSEEITQQKSSNELSENSSRQILKPKSNKDQKIVSTEDQKVSSKKNSSVSQLDKNAPAKEEVKVTSKEIVLDNAEQNNKAFTQEAKTTSAIDMEEVSQTNNDQSSQDEMTEFTATIVKNPKKSTPKNTRNEKPSNVKILKKESIKVAMNDLKQFLRQDRKMNLAETCNETLKEKPVETIKEKSEEIRMEKSVEPPKKKANEVAKDNSTIGSLEKPKSVKATRGRPRSKSVVVESIKDFESMELIPIVPAIDPRQLIKNSRVELERNIDLMLQTPKPRRGRPKSLIDSPSSVTTDSSFDNEPLSNLLTNEGRASRRKSIARNIFPKSSVDSEIYAKPEKRTDSVIGQKTPIDLSSSKKKKKIDSKEAGFEKNRPDVSQGEDKKETTKANKKIAKNLVTAPEPLRKTQSSNDLNEKQRVSMDISIAPNDNCVEAATNKKKRGRPKLIQPNRSKGNIEPSDADQTAIAADARKTADEPSRIDRIQEPQVSVRNKTKKGPIKKQSTAAERKSFSSEIITEAPATVTSVDSNKIAIVETPLKPRNYSRIPKILPRPVSDSDADLGVGDDIYAFSNRSATVTQHKKPQKSISRDSGAVDIDISLTSSIDLKITEESFALPFTVTRTPSRKSVSHSFRKESTPPSPQTPRRRSNRNKTPHLPPDKNRIKAINDIVASFMDEDDVVQRPSSVNEQQFPKGPARLLNVEAVFIADNHSEQTDDGNLRPSSESVAGPSSKEQEDKIGDGKKSFDTSVFDFDTAEENSSTALINADQNVTKTPKKRGRKRFSDKDESDKIARVPSSASCPVIEKQPEIVKVQESPPVPVQQRKPRGRRKSIYTTDRPSERLSQVSPPIHKCQSPIPDVKQSLTQKEIADAGSKKLSNLSDMENRPESTNKKQRRRRKNELAAIIADQLLESFKEVDKSRINDLKILENLAYEKSEDLFLTGMRLTPTTKRTMTLSEKESEKDSLATASANKSKANRRSKSQPNSKSEIECEDRKDVSKNQNKNETTAETSPPKRSKISENVSQSHENLFRTSSNEPLKLTVEPLSQKQHFRICSNFNTTSFDAFSTFKSSFDTFRSLTDFSFMGSRKEILRKSNFVPGSAETSNSVDSQSNRLTDEQSKTKEPSERSKGSSEFKKKLKKKLTRKKEKKGEIENINELRSGLESFTFGKGGLEGFPLKSLGSFGFFKTKTNESVLEKNSQSSATIGNDVVDLSDDVSNSQTYLKKPLLRPSILAAVTVEHKPQEATNAAPDVTPKTISSRDPRLKKNKWPAATASKVNDEDTMTQMDRRKMGSIRQRRKSERDIPSSSLYSDELNTAFVKPSEKLKPTRGRGRPSKAKKMTEELASSRMKANLPTPSALDSDEEDTCLAALAKSVKDRIRGSDDEEFNDAQDGFNMAPSFRLLEQPPRPVSAMDIRTHRLLNDDNSIGEFLGDDDNTNTELIDMDLEDDVSVYTSFSQDVRRFGSGKFGHRRRRRRSILFSRRPKKTIIDPDLPEVTFDCTICNKTFRKPIALTKHRMTLTHISKLSEHEYLLASKKRKSASPVPVETTSPTPAIVQPALVPPTVQDSKDVVLLQPGATYNDSHIDLTEREDDTDHEDEVNEASGNLVEDVEEIPAVPEEEAASANENSDKLPISSTPTQQPPPPVISLLNQSGIEPISSPEQVDTNYERYQNTSSRIALSQEERLFYECCNMLKGSETPMVERTYPVIPNTYSTYDVPNKPVTPRSSERFSYLGSEASGNFQHSTAYTVKSPMSHSRTSPRHAYPKIDINQFSDISSDSNPAFPREQPHPNLAFAVGGGESTATNRFSAYNETKPPGALEGGAQRVTHSTFLQSGNVQNFPGPYFAGENSYAAKEFPSVGREGNIDPMSARTFIDEERTLRENTAMPVFPLEGPPERNTSAVEQTQTFTSPLHSTSSQGSTTTTCRMRTKAAMKGYDNFKVSIPTVGLDMQQALERSPHNGCKLTALAEIALGSEAPTTTNGSAPATRFPAYQSTEEAPFDPQAKVRPEIGEKFAKKYQELIISNMKPTAQKVGKKKEPMDKSGNKLGFKARKNKPRNCKEMQEIVERPVDKPKDIYEFDDSEEQIVQENKALPKPRGFKVQDQQIVIPERPFKDIGLEEQLTDKMQQSNEISSNQNDESVMSSTSYSDRDDFNYGSMSENDDPDDDGEINSESESNASSARTTKTIEHKCLIVGRIFKNATKNRTEEKKDEKPLVEPKKKIPTQELDKLFDSLRKDEECGELGPENSDKVATNIHKAENHSNENCTTASEKPDKFKIPEKVENQTTEKQKDEDTKIDKTGKQNAKTEKRPLVEKKRKEKIVQQPRELEKLQTELGMTPEEIAELIGEGQRKSQRRCATNRQRKFVEIWSSDEYEEFQSTKDIIALIEEKEKRSQRKRKNNKSAERNKEQNETPNEKNTKNTPPTEKEVEKKVDESAKIVEPKVGAAPTTNKKPQKIVDRLLEKFTRGKITAANKKKLNQINTKKPAESIPAKPAKNTGTDKEVNVMPQLVKEAPIIEGSSNKKPTLSVKPRLKAHISPESESDFETELKTNTPTLKQRGKIKKRRKTISFKADEVQRFSKSSAISSVPRMPATKIQSQPNDPKKPIVAPAPAGTGSISPRQANGSDGKESGGGKGGVIANINESNNKPKAINSPKTSEGSVRPLARRKRVASEMLYYWSSSSDEEFGRIQTRDDDDLSQNGEPYQQHGWIVGDSHKKLVTLLAIAKGKKVEDCGVKETVTKKK